MSGDLKSMSIQKYHWATAHNRSRMSPHAMDYTLYPLPFKPYGRGETPVIILPEPSEKGPGNLRLSELLSSLLFLSYGVTAVRQTRGIPFLSRTVPSAGGLYPCHLYMGLATDRASETGVYYYDPPGHGLKQLRRAADTPWVDHIPAEEISLFFMVFGDIYNSAWKYRERSYRYLLLDAGHLVRNMVLAGDALGMAVSVHYDFEDRALAELVAADPERELPLAVVTMNWNKSVPELLRIFREDTEPCYPELRFRKGEAEYLKAYPLPARAHRAGVFGNDHGQEIRATPGRAMALADLFPLVTGRRSRRNFVDEPVGKKEQERLLDWFSISPLPGMGIYMVCQSWEGLDKGIYTLSRPGRRPVPVRKGAFSRKLARICLGQSWVGNAGATFCFTADLKFLEEKYGFRGYRYALMASGELGHLIYLGAQELGHGCCGIGALYDGEAQALLGLDQDSALLYAVSTGPVKKY